MNTNVTPLQNVLNKCANGLFAIEVTGLPCPTWWAGEFEGDGIQDDDPWLTDDPGYAACFTSKEKAIEGFEYLSNKHPNKSFRIAGF